MLGKPISLNIAFDSLTEEQFNKLKKVFCIESLGELILDETPYKKLLVKSNGTQQIKYLCFLENKRRVYKGEGTLTFESISPFYECTSPYLDSYFQEDYMSDWDDDNNNFLYNNYPIDFYQENIGENKQKYNVSVEGSNFYFWTPVSPGIPIDPTIYLYINSSDRSEIHSISIGMYMVYTANDMERNRARDLFQLNNLKLSDNDSFLILNFKKFLAYGATTVDDKIVPNGNDYYRNINVNSSQVDKKDIPYYWNQHGTKTIIYNSIEGLKDLNHRPRIEVTFYTSNMANNSYELELTPREDLNEERHTGIYDVRYTNKVY